MARTCSVFQEKPIIELKEDSDVTITPEQMTWHWSHNQNRKEIIPCIMPPEADTYRYGDHARSRLMESEVLGQYKATQCLTFIVEPCGKIVAFSNSYGTSYTYNPNDNKHSLESLVLSRKVRPEDLRGITITNKLPSMLDDNNTVSNKGRLFQTLLENILRAFPNLTVVDFHIPPKFSNVSGFVSILSNTFLKHPSFTIESEEACISVLWNNPQGHRRSCRVFLLEEDNAIFVDHTTTGTKGEESVFCHLLEALVSLPNLGCYSRQEGSQWEMNAFPKVIDSTSLTTLNWSGDNLERYFESEEFEQRDVWANDQLKLLLNALSPNDNAGDGSARKRKRGILMGYLPNLKTLNLQDVWCNQVSVADIFQMLHTNTTIRHLKLEAKVHDGLETDDDDDEEEEEGKSAVEPFHFVYEGFSGNRRTKVILSALRNNKTLETLQVGVPVRKRSYMKKLMLYQLGPALLQNHRISVITFRHEGRNLNWNHDPIIQWQLDLNYFQCRPFVVDPGFPEDEQPQRSPRAKFPTVFRAAVEKELQEKEGKLSSFLDRLFSENSHLLIPLVTATLDCQNHKSA